MTDALREGLIAAGETGLVVTVVKETLPFASAQPPTRAAFMDARDAAAWIHVARHHRPWCVHQISTERVVDPSGGEAVLLAPPSSVTPAQRDMIEAWTSARWPSQYETSWVVIDALFDELTWWGALHPKGDAPFVDAVQSIDAFLAGQDPLVSVPSELPAMQSARPMITEALAIHRRSGAAEDPCVAAYRGDVALLRTLRERGADLEHRDPAGRTPLAAALSGGLDGQPWVRLENRTQRPQTLDDVTPNERAVLELLGRGASVSSALEVIFGPRRAFDDAPLLLDLAMRRRWYRLAKHLIDVGTPVDEPVPARPVELLFLMGGPVALLDALLARGAHLDAESPIWTRALHARLARAAPALAARALPPRDG